MKPRDLKEVFSNKSGTTPTVCIGNPMAQTCRAPNISIAGTSYPGRRGLYAKQTQTSHYPKDTWALRKPGLGLQTISTLWVRAVQPKGGDVR